MVILIPIEIKVRELLSKLLMAYKLINHIDCRIFLGSQRYIFSRFKKIQNVIWLDKNTLYSKFKSKPLSNNADHFVKIMLDEEGPLVWNYGASNKLRFPPQILNFYDKIVLHGKSDFNILKKRKKKNKFIILGHPRYDLLLRYKKIFIKEKNNIRQIYKKYIFIVSSFGFDGYVSQDIENAIIKRNSFNNDVQKNLKINLIDKQKVYQNYLSLVELTKTIAEEMKDYTVIFRPHPTQDLIKVKKRFSKVPKNLKIIYEKTVTPWIMGCDFFIHSGCSTYVEAHLFKKKIINFYAYKYTNYFEFNYAGNTFFNIQKCLSFIKNNISKKNFLYNKKPIENILHNLIKNKDFCKEFAFYLKSNYGSLKPIIEKWPYKKTNFLKEKVFHILSFIKNNFILKSFVSRYLPGYLFFSKEYKDKKFNHLKKNEIVNFFNEISLIDKNNFSEKIIISKFAKDVYEIKRSNLF